MRAAHAATVLLTALASGAGAQTVPSAGAVPPTREEVQRAPTVGTAPATGPRLKVESQIERAPCPLADERFAAVKVTLRTVSFTGLKGGVSAEQLRGAYAEVLDTEQPIAIVCEIRDRAATLLRRRGFLAAIQIPAQRIENGELRLDVLFAHLAAIRVRGNAGRSEDIIAALLRPLTREEVFNEAEAERRLLMARDLPGFDVRLTLRPGETAGDVIGDITVVRTAVQLDANVQNYGSPEVGRWGGTLRAQINGLTGLGDSTTLSFYNTSDWHEQHVLTAGHSFLLGASGFAASGSFAYAWTYPNTAGLDVASRTAIGNFGLSYPLIRRRATTLRAAVGLDIADQSVDLVGVRLTTDRLRVPYLRLEGEAIAPQSVSGRDGLSAVTPRWRLGGTLELRQGVDILGASAGCGPGLARCSNGGNTPSRPFGDPRATVLRFSGQGEYRPAGLLTFAVGTRAQYSGQTLFSFEQFSAGNYTIGRGYDPGAIIGDSGVGVSVEARYGRPFPTGVRRLFVQPYVFADAVWVWNNAPPAAGNPADPQTVSSFGIGARGGWGDIARLDLALAIPAQNVLSARGGVGLQRELPPVRVLMTLSTRLWPWRRN